jgi:hypothetical protein
MEMHQLNLHVDYQKKKVYLNKNIKNFYSVIKSLPNIEFGVRP